MPSRSQQVERRFAPIISTFLVAQHGYFDPFQGHVALHGFVVDFLQGEHMGIATSSSRHPNIATLHKRLGMNPEFAVKLHDLLSPGTMLIVTDQAAERRPFRDVDFAAR